MSLSRFIAAAFVVSGLLAAACGNDDATNRDYGKPPDPNNFNPGNASQDAYGYGGGPALGPTTVACPDDLKRCAHTFTYPFNNETTVEIRGDWDGQESWDNGIQMAHTGNQWTADIPVPVSKPVQFKFILNGDTTNWVVDKTQPTIVVGTDTNNNFAGTTCDKPTCEEEGALPPGVFDWRDSVIYFVFVDRFNDGDPSLNAGCHVSGVSDSSVDYQGGDWAGVTQKINAGYFNDLGVNTLWVTVPFDNPSVTGLGTGGDTHEYSGYHGYWPNPGPTATTLTQEACFGSLDDLKTLISSAHAKGLKVLFDFAMVHVHNQSPLYKSLQDQGKADQWFWPNNKDGHDCVCGQGCSWDTDYQRCWFADYLPHWNYTNSEARDWSVSNAIAWITQTQDAAGNGADGFRDDAIKHVDISWLNSLRARLKTDVTAHQNPAQRFYMVGETYDFGNRDFIKTFVDPTTKLDGQFDFPLRKLVVESTLMRTTPMSTLATFMDSNDYFYGANAVMSTFLGNHDLPRIIHLAANTRLWGDDQGADGKNLAWSNKPGLVQETEAYERVANGFAVLFTNRGAPLVYYGDEIGQPGAGDPDNRRFMQWDGYTSNQTYLHDRIKQLSAIRAKHPALRRGTRSTINADNETWTYMRQTTGDTVYVVVNRSDGERSVNGLPAGNLFDEVTSTAATGPIVKVPARQTRIFITK
jgi:glycosidase